MPLALLVVAVFQLATAPLSSAISRRMESEADWKALGVTQDPAALERLMVEFSETGLGDPDPPFLSQLVFGTHPALADRVAMARAFAWGRSVGVRRGQTPGRAPEGHDRGREAPVPERRTASPVAGTVRPGV